MTIAYVLTNTNEADTAHGNINQQLAASIVNDATSADLASGNYATNVSMSEFSFCTQSGEPNFADWPEGLYECFLDVSAAGSGLTYGLLNINSLGHFGRVNDARDTEVEAHEQDETAFSGTGLKVATYSGPWGGATASDRFECLVAISRDGVNHGNQTLTLTVNNSGSSRATGAWVVVTASAHLHVVNEDEQVAHAQNRIMTLARSITDTQQLQEDFLSAQNMLLQVDETEQIIENSIAAQSLIREVASTLQINEVIIQMLGKIQVVDETQQIAGGGGEGTLDLQVSNILDDVSHRNNTDDFFTTGSVLVGKQTTNDWDSGLRFLGVSIPQGATIDVAHLIFTPVDTRSTNDCNSTFRIHAHDNSPRITSNAEWTAVIAALEAVSVAWDVVPTFTIDVEINSPSIVPLIQAIVDRLGFEGDAVNILWRNNASDTNAQRRGTAVDVDAGKAVKLHIEFSAGLEAIYILGINRILNETINLSETNDRILALVRVNSRTLQITEQNIKTMTILRIQDETINIVEDVVRLLEVPGALDLVEILNENINIPEGFVRLLDITRINDDTLQLEESIVPSRSLLRLLSDTVVVVEGSVPTQSKLRTLTETVQIIEQNLSLKGLSQIINETIQLITSSGFGIGIFQVVSETINIGEAKNRVRGLVKLIAETLSLNEARNRVMSLLRVVSEAVQIQDTFTKILSLVRSILEVAQIIEAKNKTMSLLRLIAETVNIIEIVAHIRGFFVVVNDTVEVIGTSVAEFGAEVFGFLVGAVSVTASTAASLSVEAVTKGFTRIKHVTKGIINFNTNVNDD